VLFTVGHGTRTTEQLAAVLRDGGVAVLCDVRRFPGSRRNPHLSREALQRDMPSLGVAYEFWGDDLGGRRSSRADSRHTAWRVDAFRGYADWTESDAYREAMTTLLSRAATESLAVMCAETLWWRCHRRLISDTAAVRGVDVVHLLDVNSRQPHKPEPSVRRGDDGWPVWDAGVQPLSPG
jgi:uncharacterized protein (DUF488 family)